MSPEKKAGVLVLALLALLAGAYVTTVVSMGSNGYIGGYSAGNR